MVNGDDICTEAALNQPRRLAVGEMLLTREITSHQIATAVKNNSDIRLADGAAMQILPALALNVVQTRVDSRELALFALDVIVHVRDFLSTPRSTPIVASARNRTL